MSKGKNLGSILDCNEITLSPERFGSPQKWGWGQHRGTEQPRPGLPVRVQLLENHQGTCANGDPLDPTPPNDSPLLWEPTRLERLKFKVTFTVTEMKANTQSKQWSNTNGQSEMLVSDWNPKIKQLSSGSSGKQCSHGSRKSPWTYKQAQFPEMHTRAQEY